ncbi:NSFL1 cofactor p47 [Galdieria sulphuraria]|uniref:UBX domain-containing protein 1 n=1 Tax=Galdieria sulphuraria TaxID=130081 RepID=M2Y370_GALSU|nr:uncharacterized protein Gasu_24150 [Galdieria sulphuraria]EME30264.1 hypothetical protein Gasu_24150 [Galdieria sulphuraria]GJD08429.1 NSFL1 cofactor p47 [Galdieria sulphuraria]|eukprot:XP_005706784.1 hypothetical protein Gasu_24150 [Galdieria sulphuraria]
MSEDAKVAQIVSLTGLSTEQAKFFLDSCGGDTEAALNTYLETQPEEQLSRCEEVETRASEVFEESSPPRETVYREKHIMTDKQSSSSRQPKRGGVASLRDLLPEEPSPEEESGKNYYAGGERSGQMIQDPRRPPRNDNENELTRKIFEKAMQYNEQPEEDVDFSNRQRFTGAGYRLGDGRDGSSLSQPVVMGKKNVVKTLTFYKNGFQVDEGPLREYDDPANQQFLREVESGYVPREMEEPGMGNVSINLVDKKDEEFVPPKPKVQPFTGRGYRLSEGMGSSYEATSSATESGGSEMEHKPSELDPNKPTTSIQIRLHDGTRVVARFNEDQTLGDIRRFVSSARPLPSNAAFELSLQFPRQILSEDSKTISELGLKGSVIVQTLK